MNRDCYYGRHTWSGWVSKSETEQHSDGLYYKTWQERWCVYCQKTEYSNFNHTKIGSG